MSVDASSLNNVVRHFAIVHGVDENLKSRIKHYDFTKFLLIDFNPFNIEAS